MSVYYFFDISVRWSEQDHAVALWNSPETEKQCSTVFACSNGTVGNTSGNKLIAIREKQQSDVIQIKSPMATKRECSKYKYFFYNRA